MFKIICEISPLQKNIYVNNGNNFQVQKSLSQNYYEALGFCVGLVKRCYLKHQGAISLICNFFFVLFVKNASFIIALV